MVSLALSPNRTCTFRYASGSPGIEVKFVTPLIQFSLNAEYPGIICLEIQVHGLLLRHWRCIDSLPAFAMWPAFPISDYYAGSALVLTHPGSLPVACFPCGRMRTSSQVPFLNRWILRWHALPLVVLGSGYGDIPLPKLIFLSWQLQDRKSWPHSSKAISLLEDCKLNTEASTACFVVSS